MNLERELHEALAAVALAGEYARREYEAFKPIPNAAASISTHVDHEAQQIILRHLRTAFPDDGICAEEKTPLAETAQNNTHRVWVVDPIDGTRGFAMKNGEFSVMVGFTVNQIAVLGVVLEPILHRTTYAALGQGCWMKVGEEAPRQCHVTALPTLEKAVLTQSHSKPGQPPKSVVTSLQPVQIIETYSAGIKLAMVARGEVEMYVNDYRNFHDWDICAGHILVEEAGGRVSLFNGQPVTYGGIGAKQRRGMVATNGHIHSEVVERLSTI